MIVRFGPANTLAGRLDTPSHSRGYGVVLIGGSGPSDRENDGFFGPVRRQFLAAGAAVLSYDKRGVGESQGDWGTATLVVPADDAIAAATTLGSAIGVSADALVLFGHSEGGWVALRAAVRGAGVGRLILNSCPATPFLDAEAWAFHAAGATWAEAQEAARFLGVLGRAAASGASVEDATRAVSRVMEAPWFETLHRAGFELTSQFWSQAAIWCAYDPTPDLHRCTTPTLAVFGDADALVPVEASVRAYDASAAETQRVQQIWRFPGLDHRLREPGSTLPSAAYLSALGSWAARPR